MDNRCRDSYIGLSLTCIALLISVCFNILQYSLRRRERRNKAVEEPLYLDSHQSDRFENEVEEEIELSQENPIYGNINVDVAGPSRIGVSYECESKQRMRRDDKAESADISYASLDLTVNQKWKKKKKFQQTQTHQAQTHSLPMVQRSSLELGMDSESAFPPRMGSESAFPPRMGSLMASRHSIYLNSHQVAIETEERERERERMRERKLNYERQMETMDMQGDYEPGFDQSDPSHNQAS